MGLEEGLGRHGDGEADGGVESSDEGAGNGRLLCGESRGH